MPEPAAPIVASSSPSEVEVHESNSNAGRRRMRCTVVIVMVGVIACAVPEPPHAVWVTIPEDAPVEAVAESLATHDIVSSAESFARFARMGRKHRGIKPGIYPLRAGMPMGRVLAALRKGRAPVQRIPVREGGWLREVAFTIEQRLGIPAESIYAAATDSSLRARVGARGETVDGYLYPTTYYVHVDASADEVLRQMVDTFEARWKPEWDARLDTLRMSRDEVVTLASIVEGELVRGDDRTEIASVYHNRLVKSMRLQADPTVVYALGKRRRLYHGDYNVKSAYNTYRINGLPPSPISQPSSASLEATLYPPRTEYLYFVARRDGSHVFSRTYREHLATIRRVRARRRSSIGQ